jgi:hypothetical protein
MNLAALAWLLERDLIDEAQARDAIHAGYGEHRNPNVRTFLAEYGTLGFHRHDLGCLLLRLLPTLDSPLPARAAAVSEVSRVMLRPGSELAQHARGIESHFEPGVHATTADAEAAAAAQLQSIAGYVDDRPWLGLDRARTHLKETETYGAGARWAIVPFAAAGLIVAMLRGSVVADGSGWIPVWWVITWFAVAVCALWAVRSPRTQLTPSGIEIRSLLRTRRASWSEVCDVDIDTVEEDSGTIIGTVEAQHVAITLRDPGSSELRDRIRVPIGRRSAAAVHDEIVAYARTRGADITEWPDATPTRMLADVLGYVAMAAVLFALPFGFGICRYGDCGEGWVITRLATKTSSDQVEVVIERRYESMGASDVKVTCPARVTTDPDETFRCRVRGIHEFDEVDVHFSDRGRSHLAWDPVLE